MKPTHLTHKSEEESDWPQEPWLADDRDWFAARPKRRYRIRRTPEGEKEAFGKQIKADPVPVGGTNGRPHWDYTIVIQLHPGVRMRHFIFLFDYVETPDIYWPNDKAAWAFIQHCLGTP